MSDMSSTTSQHWALHCNQTVCVVNDKGPLPLLQNQTLIPSHMTFIITCLSVFTLLMTFIMLLILIKIARGRGHIRSRDQEVQVNEFCIDLDDSFRMSNLPNDILRRNSSQKRERQTGERRTFFSPYPVYTELEGSNCSYVGADFPKDTLVLLESDLEDFDESEEDDDDTDLDDARLCEEPPSFTYDIPRNRITSDVKYENIPGSHKENIKMESGENLQRMDTKLEMEIKLKAEEASLDIEIPLCNGPETIPRDSRIMSKTDIETANAGYLIPIADEDIDYLVPKSEDYLEPRSRNSGYLVPQQSPQTQRVHQEKDMRSGGKKLFTNRAKCYSVVSQFTRKSARPSSAGKSRNSCPSDSKNDISRILILKKRHKSDKSKHNRSKSFHSVRRVARTTKPTEDRPKSSLPGTFVFDERELIDDDYKRKDQSARRSSLLRKESKRRSSDRKSNTQSRPGSLHSPFLRHSNLLQESDRNSFTSQFSTVSSSIASSIQPQQRQQKQTQMQDLNQQQRQQQDDESLLGTYVLIDQRFASAAAPPKMVFKERHSTQDNQAKSVTHERHSLPVFSTFRPKSGEKTSELKFPKDRLLKTEIKSSDGKPNEVKVDIGEKEQEKSDEVESLSAKVIEDDDKPEEGNNDKNGESEDSMPDLPPKMKANFAEYVCMNATASSPQTPRQSRYFTPNHSNRDLMESISSSPVVSMTTFTGGRASSAVVPSNESQTLYGNVERVESSDVKNESPPGTPHMSARSQTTDDQLYVNMAANEPEVEITNL